jgi:hypothetical protein
MRWLAAILALLAIPIGLAAGVERAEPAGQPSIFVKFRLPAGNIGCSGFVGATGKPSYLRCDILSGLKPQPQQACELDWTGYSLRPTGGARAVCAGDTAYDNRARVLRYGSTWRQGPFLCGSGRMGLRCRNREGRGFVLSRARSYAF